MNFKKTITGISALSLLISSGAFTAMNAFAADAAEYRTGKITAHLYSEEKLKDIECRYYNDMPNVPYIKLSDYYSCWISQELQITNKNNGTYEVTVPIGVTGTIDVNKDTVSSDDFVKFICPQYVIDSNTSNFYTYVKSITELDEKESETIDFADYNIDLRGDDNDIWWPVSTLCDFYEFNYNQGALIDDVLYFFNSITDKKYSREAIGTSEAHKEVFTEKYKNGRPKDLVEYNYNELCFNFDACYGFPGRFIYNDLLAETNFDTMLSTASDSTKKIKELLLSEDVYDYCAGYELLNNYFWDGGHTFFYNTMIGLDTDYGNKVSEKFASLTGLEDAMNYRAIMDNAYYSANSAYTALTKMCETADTYEEFNDSIYAVKGDTAVFSFMVFSDESDKWMSYYYENGEMPQDLISEFYNCITKANEDPAIKNFVIDLGANIGGSTGVLEYMMGLINDLDNITIISGSGDESATAQYLVDKNLDKSFDEKDKALKLDLNFAIITSNYSFSCANLMPALAKDAGIMLVGEKSGGGTCATNRYVTPDGLVYSLSIGQKFVNKDGDTIDNGIQPDYDIVKINDDGTKDYSEVYNFSKLSSLFSDFYSNKAETISSSTTTSATTTTTSATTTTTTSLSSTTINETTTASSTSSSAASTSSSTTQNADGTLPNTGNNSVGTAAAAACAAVVTFAGGALIFISRKNRNKEDESIS